MGLVPRPLTGIFEVDVAVLRSYRPRNRRWQARIDRMVEAYEERGEGRMCNAKDTSRDELFYRARKLADEVDQIFRDADHWNRTHPEEEPIDPDPSGQLRDLQVGFRSTIGSRNGREEE